MRTSIAIGIGALAAAAGGAAGFAAAETKGSAESKPQVVHVEERVRDNDAYRRVLTTGKRSQIVAMQIPVGESIGKESHAHVEQILVVVRGTARVEHDGGSQPVREGDLVLVPPGATHDVVNTGKQPLELYTIYAPPNHLPGRVHATKADADADEADEAFGERVR